MPLVRIREVIAKSEADDAEAVEGICELTLETRDRARMESFYSGALELPVVSRDGRPDVACVWT